MRFRTSQEQLLQWLAKPLSENRNNVSCLFNLNCLPLALMRIPLLLPDLLLLGLACECPWFPARLSSLATPSSLWGTVFSVCLTTYLTRIQLAKI